MQSRDHLAFDGYTRRVTPLSKEQYQIPLDDYAEWIHLQSAILSDLNAFLTVLVAA